VNKESECIISDRISEIANRFTEKDVRSENLSENSSKINMLNEMQLRYLEKSNKFPSYCRPFCWMFLSLVLLGCCIVLSYFGLNFDRDEYMEPDYEIVGAATTHCNVWVHDDIPVYLDLPITSMLNYQAANATAYRMNNKFRRYPEPKIKVYSDGTSETIRFFTAAFGTWVVGIICLPLLKNFLDALMLAFKNRSFFRKIAEISEWHDFKGSQELSNEDFKFLLIFFPFALLETGNIEHNARPILKRGGCCNSQEDLDGPIVEKFLSIDGQEGEGPEGGLNVF
jgi:hypothetical protein